MFRISILCRLAVSHGFIDAGRTSALIEAYKEAVKSTPNVPFMQWAIRAGHLTKEQAGVMKEAYPAVEIDCVDCGNEFKAGDTDIRKPLACPNCGSANLVVKESEVGRPEFAETLLDFHTSEAPAPGSPLSTGSSVPADSPSSSAGLGPDTIRRQGDFTPAGPSDPGLAIASASENIAPPPPPSRTRPSGRQVSPPHSPNSSESSVLGESFGAPPPTLHTDGTVSGGGPGEMGVIPPGAIIGGCRVIKKIGQGGMGAVYQAHHLALDKPVALKILAPHLVENRTQILRFIREARSAARLEHNNIVGVLNVGEENRRFFLIMQWVDGESVQNVLDREGVLPPDKAVGLILQAARGLHEAHKKTIIHRDIKPDNLMITEDGTVKVADFGLAKAQESDLSVSQSGVILGTPYYMSPEQGQNSDVDHRSDIYSLGVTLYQLLTGKVPFTGSSAVQIIMKHIRDPMPPPIQLLPSLPTELNDIVVRMTAKDINHRYQDMGDVIADLERVRPQLSGDKPDVTAMQGGQTAEAEFQPTAAAAPGGTLASGTPMVPPGVHGQTVPLAPGTMLTSADGTPLVVMPSHPKQPSGVGAAVTIAIVLLLLVGGGAVAVWYYAIYLPSQDPGPLANRDNPDRNGNGNGNRNGNGNTDANGNGNRDVNGNGNGNQDGNANANANQNNGNGNANANQNTNQNANQPPDRRRKEAEALIEALVKTWREESGDPQRYAEFEERFRGFKLDYASFPDLTERADRMLEVVDEARENAANSWYLEKTRLIRQHKADYEFDKVEEILKTFPAWFEGTDTADVVRKELADVKEDADRVRKAVARLQQLEEVMAKLTADNTEEVLASAERILMDLETDQYQRTWIQKERVPELKRQIEGIRLNLNRTRIERDWSDLTREVSELRQRSEFRKAGDRIRDEYHKFEQYGEYRRKADSLLNDVKKESATYWRDDIMDRLRRMEEAGRYQQLFALLQSVREWGFEQQISDAREWQEGFTLRFVKARLGRAFDERDHERGLRLCDEFLRNPGFVDRKAYIERMQTRFTLLAAGMLPVRIRGGALPSPDGRDTWEMKSFWIDRYEVTNAEFLKFLEAGGYNQREYWSDAGWKARDDYKRAGVYQPDGWTGGRPKAGTDKQPVTGISSFEAAAYAKWAGKQLPTMRQWMAAAGWDPTAGDTREGAWRVYPWGDSFRGPDGRIPGHVWHRGITDPRVADVDTFDKDISPWGAIGMGGNVREWTATPDPEPAFAEDRVVVCGAHFNSQMDTEKVTKVAAFEPRFRFSREPFTGFRCVRVLPFDEESDE